MCAYRFCVGARACMGLCAHVRLWEIEHRDPVDSHVGKSFRSCLRVGRRLVEKETRGGTRRAGSLLSCSLYTARCCTNARASQWPYLLQSWWPAPLIDVGRSWWCYVFAAGVGGKVALGGGGHGVRHGRLWRLFARPQRHRVQIRDRLGRESFVAHGFAFIDEGACIRMRSRSSRRAVKRFLAHARLDDVAFCSHDGSTRRSVAAAFSRRGDFSEVGTRPLLSTPVMLAESRGTGAVA